MANPTGTSYVLPNSRVGYRVGRQGSGIAVKKSRSQDSIAIVYGALHESLRLLRASMQILTTR